MPTMSNWIGGLPAEAKAQKDIKKAIKNGIPTGLPNGGDPIMFYGGAIPSVRPKLPKYKEELPPKVEITGARSPISKDPLAEPKMPLSSSTATPSTPLLPLTPPPFPDSKSKPTLQSYSPLQLPNHFPSVFNKKPMKRKKKKKKPPIPPPPKPIQCYDDVRNDQDNEGLGQISSIFAICYIPATCQGLDLKDCGGYGEKEDLSGHVSPCSWEVDEGLDIPHVVLSYMLRDEFVGFFGTKIDARKLAEVLGETL